MRPAATEGSKVIWACPVAASGSASGGDLGLGRSAAQVAPHGFGDANNGCLGERLIKHGMPLRGHETVVPFEVWGVDAWPQVPVIVPIPEAWRVDRGWALWR